MTWKFQWQQRNLLKWRIILKKNNISEQQKTISWTGIFSKINHRSYTSNNINIAHQSNDISVVSS